MGTQKHREISSAVILDNAGCFLLQQRDDVPGILQPGKIALFGGNREPRETPLECIVREIHEELSCFVPPERFEFIFSQEGPDLDRAGGTASAVFYLVKGIPVDAVSVTEGSLLIAWPEELPDLAPRMTPLSWHVINVFRDRANRPGPQRGRRLRCPKR